MKKEDLRIVYMGTPEFAVECLRALVEHGYQVVGVVTMPDKPMGRHGSVLQSSAVKKYAESVGLPILQPEKLKDEAFLEALRAGIIDLTPEQMGIYTGSTLHEVAHVVGAGNAMGKEISDAAIIVKMIRVMMLAPVLVVMSFMLARTAVKAVNHAGKATNERRKITIPWFAFGFLAVIGFNSLDLLPAPVVTTINNIDTFMLTMAMTALGTETSIEKFKKAGAKPFLLAALLYIWLLVGGYLLAKYVTPILG